MQEVWTLLRVHWLAMDEINLVLSLRKLAKMAEESGDAAAFKNRCLENNGTFAWLLGERCLPLHAAALGMHGHGGPQRERNRSWVMFRLAGSHPNLQLFAHPCSAENLQQACSSKGFNGWATINSFAALAKLRCGTPALAAALQQPLMRALVGDADKPAPFGLSHLLWALAKDWANCRHVFVAVKRRLLELAGHYMAQFDAQVGARRVRQRGRECLCMPWQRA